MPGNEHPAADQAQARKESLGRTRENGELPDAVDAEATLQRMEKLLQGIRGALDATAREERHAEFPLRRLVAAVLQVIVVGLLFLALLDWLLDAGTDAVLIKLAFAAVLQLTALTAFLVGGGSR